MVVVYGNDMKVAEEIHPPIDWWRSSFVTDWLENWLFHFGGLFSPRVYASRFRVRTNR